MRILQFCGRVPYPPTDGGRIAMANIARGLVAAGAHVDVLALNTSRHHVTSSEIRNFVLPIEAVEVNTDLRPVGALKNLFTGESYHVARFRSAAAAQRLDELLRATRYDVVQLESIYLAEYLPAIRRSSDAIVVLRALNLDHEIWERVRDQTPAGLRRLYLGLQASRLRRYEMSHLDKFDAIVPITRRDAEAIDRAGCSRPAHVAPFGVFLEEYSPGSAARDRSVFHIGSLDWAPNQDAVRWLIEQIWPRVRKSVPDARLVVGGSAPPAWLHRAAALRGVELSSNIADAKKFMTEHSVMVVPVRSGGGMRVKIIEGMALAKNIVSTSLGIEGIAAIDGRHLRIADDADSFATAIVELLTKTDDLGANARRLVEERYDARRIAASLLDFYGSIVRAYSSSASRAKE